MSEKIRNIGKLWFESENFEKKIVLTFTFECESYHMVKLDDLFKNCLKKDCDVFIRSVDDEENKYNLYINIVDENYISEAKACVIAIFSTYREAYISGYLSGSYQQEKRWINLKQIKPPLEEEVLILFKNEYVLLGEFVQIDDGEIIPKGMITCSSNEATHWYPVPPLPEEISINKEV